MMNPHKHLVESDHMFSAPSSGLEYEMSDSRCGPVSSHSLLHDDHDNCENLADRHENLMITGCKGIEDIEEMIQNSGDMEGEGDEIIDGENLGDHDREEMGGKLSKKRSRRDRDSSTSSSSTATSKKVSIRYKLWIKSIIDILPNHVIVPELSVSSI